MFFIKIKLRWLIVRKNRQNRPLLHIGGVYAEEPSITMQFTPVASGQVIPMDYKQFTPKAYGQPGPARMRPRADLSLTKKRISDRSSGT